MANYKVEQVEGIGPATGEKLRAAGIDDTDALLAACRTPAGRKALAEQTGLTAAKLLGFAGMVDLFRIDGVGGEYAELLAAAGVDTVAELAQRNAANLVVALAAANEKSNLTRRVPTEASVEKWIAQARTLPRVIEH